MGTDRGSCIKKLRPNDTWVSVKLTDGVTTIDMKTTTERALVGWSDMSPCDMGSDDAFPVARPEMSQYPHRV